MNGALTPQKRLAYRLWIGLVLLLEYIIIKKQKAMMSNAKQGGELLAWLLAVDSEQLAWVSQLTTGRLCGQLACNTTWLRNAE